MQVQVYNLTGEVIRNIEVSDAVFGVPLNEAVVHQAVVRQEANARQGTASTKTRGEVAGSGVKLYAQKHTGRARAGDVRSPTRRKGGVAFGPKPRDYRQAMPKRMRRLAIKCVLSGKAGDGELRVIDGFKFEKPSTAEMVRIMSALRADASALVVTEAADRNVILSARNLVAVKTLPANLINVIDVLSHRMLIMTEAAVRKAEQIWGGARGESNEPV